MQRLQQLVSDAEATTSLAKQRAEAAQAAAASVKAVAAAEVAAQAAETRKEVQRLQNQLHEAEMTAEARLQGAASYSTTL